MLVQWAPMFLESHYTKQYILIFSGDKVYTNICTMMLHKHLLVKCILSVICGMKV